MSVDVVPVVMYICSAGRLAPVGLYLHWGPGHPPPAERGPSLESIYRVSLTVDLCEGNKIISLKKFISPQPVGGPSKRKNPGALGTCPLVKTALASTVAREVYRSSRHCMGKDTKRRGSAWACALAGMSTPAGSDRTRLDYCNSLETAREWPRRCRPAR